MSPQFIADGQERIREFLAVLARHLNGDLTLNQVRVLQFINLCWRHRSAASTGHVEMCNELNLPSATVSRAVAKFIEMGLVGEEVDPADGRRRFVVATGVIPGAHEKNDLDLALAQLITGQPGDQP